MRRIFISLLAAVTLFTFTACGQTAILISRTKQDKKWTLGEIPKPDGWDVTNVSKAPDGACSVGRFRAEIALK